MNITNVPINDLHEADYNPRKMTQKQVDDLTSSIKEFGLVDPIVVNSNKDRHNVVIGGHQRLKIARSLGFTEIPVVYIDLTLEREKKLNLRLNRNNGEWDWESLANNFDIDTLIDVGFDNKELNIFIEPSEKDDQTPEIPVEPKSKLGDLYELGQHRVLCGDSTQPEAVLRLMDGKKADIVVTDPPYNTGMEGKPKDEKARLSHMFNDSFTPEQWSTFLTDFFANYFVNTKGDCAYYVFIDWRRVNDIRSVMEKQMDVKNVIVWDKKVHGLGSDYKSTYELCVVGKKGKPNIQNRYGLDYQDIWRLQREMGRNKDHATAKPIELLEKPLKHASKADDICLDLFLGSGSTLIASEKTGRICYGMELDPKYIDVIVQRYVDFTGNTKIKKNGEEIEWKP